MTALVASVVTVRLSILQFRTERWWERKAEAYARIITALFHLRHYNAGVIRDAEEHGDGKSPELDRRGARSAEAERKIEEATAIGSFIISEDVSNALHELRRDRDRVWSRLGLDATWPEYIQCLVEENATLDKALAAVPQRARKDLAVR